MALILGEDGQVVTYNADAKIDKPETIKNSGVLRNMRVIDKRAFAVGSSRHVFRRDAPNKWTVMHAKKKQNKSDDDAMFEAIDGFAADDLYVVGWDGEIWHHDGKAWKQQKSGTDVVLSAFCCAGDGAVYACGQDGTLLRGVDRKWTNIKTGGDDLWGVCWFNDTLYVAEIDELYTLAKGKLARVKFGKKRPRSFYKLSAAEGVMWSIGATDVYSFDGKTWTPVAG